jgi:DNA-binding CsgD family transcriptional regulator
MVVGGAACGIAEADGQRAGLFCPGDRVVTRAPGGPRTTSRLTGTCRSSRNAWTSAVIVVATPMAMATSSPCPMPYSVEVGLIGVAGALVVRAPVIAGALREYFELLWERAAPLGPQRHAAPGDRLTCAQQNVLELMARGLPDQVIAHRAGVSVTTVRRHIAAIMRQLGVTSRFAAGAAAQRRGWIG